MCGDECTDKDSDTRQREDTGEKTGTEDPSVSPPAEGHESPCTSASPESFSGMTLEQIIDLTGEFSHLNELVMIHIEHAGGFTGADAYFRTVQPILDLLEVEIRIRCSAGITQQQMKLVVQDWIDQEIRACLEGPGTHGQ
jgi:hypothetical protein